MLTIKANIRKDQGKSSSRRLRISGKLPAIVYGNNTKPVSVSIAHDATWNMQEKKEFYAEVITLIIDEKKHSVKVQAIQRHPFRRKLIHIDFLHIKSPTIFS
ncbi:50S ribosomal protein L25 [Candidatus Profftia sp. (ex Adelges kitamiensis)]|uniref:50S ribosomal protein L25 n=1 Tax=Candidatus Profftia sp. (ex Adelges kitamiensis) TaxID=2864218 RepID=UPI001CE24A55|nr:50S ribosomal protein L25 [Candidatus Profftia sp. (ex Adelges kitamiensis)]